VLVLTIAVIVVVVSFAHQPLFGSDGNAAAFGQPLTLWMAGSGAGERAAVVAEQAASCWDLKGRAAGVGVLPGGSASAVAHFFARVHGESDELLVITSTTLADIAHERGNAVGSEEDRERAQRAANLLAGAAPVAVLASDPLEFAVRADSPVRKTAQVLSLMRQWTAGPLFDVSANAWLRGNLASLVLLAGLRGEVPYGVFDSSSEALASLGAGQGEVALAPRSAIRQEMHADKLRELPWPAPAGLGPRAWVAVLAPAGISASELANLRAQAHSLCAGAVWARLLRTDGLAPAPSASVPLGRFVRIGMGDSSQLQTLAAKVMRDY
jgi:hypothetical protein